MVVLAASGCTEDEATPLYEAVSVGDSAWVRERIAEGDDVDQMSPPYGFTPLMEAAGLNDAIAGLLLEVGADPNVRDSDGWTALAFAAYRRSASAVELLLEAGADAELEPTGGESAGKSICSMAGGPETEAGALVC
jgi:ankyrin repeat protein